LSINYFVQIEIK